MRNYDSGRSLRFTYFLAHLLFNRCVTDLLLALRFSRIPVSPTRSMFTGYRKGTLWKDGRGEKPTVLSLLDSRHDARMLTIARELSTYGCQLHHFPTHI